MQIWLTLLITHTMINHDSGSARDAATATPGVDGAVEVSVTPGVDDAVEGSVTPGVDDAVEGSVTPG